MVTKREFIMKFLDALRRELEQGLPDQDYLFKMQEQAWELIMVKNNHIRGRR